MAVFLGRAISLKAMNTPLKISTFLFLVSFMGYVEAVHAQTPRASCDKVDWSTLPSRFTHDSTGQRVPQYAAKVEPVAQQRSDYQRSGYRNFRSSIQVGSSADNMHVVEQWGAAVEPYEAWRFPFRPYGVPYQQWGPNTQFWGATPFWPGPIWPNGAGPFPPNQPYPGHGHPPHEAMPANGGGGAMGNGHWPHPYGPGGFGPGGFGPGGFGPGGFGPGGFGNGTAPWNPGVGPWTDGYYQDAPQRPRLPDRQFFYTPRMQ